MDESTIKFLAEHGFLETEKRAFEAGYDAAVHGSNTINCHFRHFRSPELTRAWEKGRDAGNHERKLYEDSKRKPPSGNSIT